MKVFRKNEEREFADLLTNVMGLNEVKLILSFSLLTKFHHNLILSFKVFTIKSVKHIMVKIEMAMKEKAIKFYKERKLEYTRIWVMNNKERNARNAKAYMDRNREAINEKAKLYQRERYKKVRAR